MADEVGAGVPETDDGGREPSETAPCPFCGSRNTSVRSWVVCRSCGAAGPDAVNGRVDAVARWNHRVPASVPLASPAEARSANWLGDPENVAWLERNYKRICGQLQDVCQEFKLGLGGEDVCRLVCDEVRALRARVPVADAEGAPE